MTPQKCEISFVQFPISNIVSLYGINIAYAYFSKAKIKGQGSDRVGFCSQTLFNLLAF
jgi:hypothetical protein